MQKIAIIDVGSNSARLVVMQILESGAYHMLYNQKEPLRLAQKINTDNQLTDSAFKDTEECMQSFMAMCRLYKVDRIIAVATAAIRNANNGLELVETVAAASGIKLEIIAGTSEAYLSYLGVINTLAVKDCVIFDLGGGSTELILVRDRQAVDSISLPIGTVNTSTRFRLKDTMSNDTYTELRSYIDDYLELAPWLKDCKLPLVGVGGTARTIAKIEQKKLRYPSSKLHNFQIPVASYNNIFSTLKDSSLSARKKVPGLDSERADIILGGLSIIKGLAERTKTPSFIISGCGLREGLFREYYVSQYKQPLVIEDILRHSAENTLSLYATDTRHSKHITKLVATMFQGWQPLHKLSGRWLELLQTAALLHDIGITINYYSHPRHSAYMIDNARLFGLTHKEQVMVSLMAAWHTGISKTVLKNRLYQDTLNENEIERVAMLSVLLAFAESLDYTQNNNITDITPSVTNKQAKLHITATTTPTLELHQLKQHVRWFEKTLNTKLTITY